jgi:hypothetical protein
VSATTGAPGTASPVAGNGLAAAELAGDGDGDGVWSACMVAGELS